MPTPFAEGGTASHQAGPAAPTLPFHQLRSLSDTAVTALARSGDDAIRGMPARVQVYCRDPIINLTPSAARLLAVYLVDCANALDNPAARVIADGPGLERVPCDTCRDPEGCMACGCDREGGL